MQLRRAAYHGVFIVGYDDGVIVGSFRVIAFNVALIHLALISVITANRIGRESEDFVLVTLGTSGVNGVFQDGREAIVSAGQFVIYDTTRPYELRFDDSFSQTIFQMPRKLLQQRIGSFDTLTATTFSGDRPLERLAYEFARNVSRTIELVDPAAASRL